MTDQKTELKNTYPGACLKPSCDHIEPYDKGHENKTDGRGHACHPVK